MKDAQVSNRIREARDRLGITQEELALRVGVTRQTIGLIERGDYNPTIRLALLLGAELSADLQELFWLSKDIPKNRISAPQ